LRGNAANQLSGAQIKAAPELNQGLPADEINDLERELHDHNLEDPDSTTGNI